MTTIRPGKAPARIPVAKVEILGGEGLIALVDAACGEYPSLAVADAAMRILAQGAPVPRAYNKTDFRITWADGQTWDGTVCINQEHVTASEIIAAHVRSIVDFESGDCQPSHLTREQYTGLIARRLAGDASHCEKFRKFRNDYALS